MNVDDIRETFIRFYTERGHLRIPSASLVPHGDPTLLFTGAGMVPFKPYFMGLAEAPAPRMCTVQKCFRTTDIEEVGDYSHLTMFEMLGNFSVGDYFKKEAIGWAWELLTEHFKLPKDDLWVSIFETDEEAHDLWRAIGLTEERIQRYPEKNNYWFSGDVGPCGPNSEIFVDRGPRVETCAFCKAGTCKPNLEPDCGRFLEVWNLVFMTLYQAEDGSRTELPKKNIDTGSGLERVACILQGKDSVYETDVFRPILAKAAETSGLVYPVVPRSSNPIAIASAERQNRGLRTLAEHTRAAAFLIADGVLPGNDGREGVLRRLIKRAIYVCSRSGGVAADMSGLSVAVIEQMGGAYPELRSSARLIVSILENEERQSSETIINGGVLLDAHLSRLMSAGKTVIPADVVFTLATERGFPKDLIAEVAREQGFTLDERGFERLMEGHRRRSRASAKFQAIAQREFAYADWNQKVEFVGYDRTQHVTKILGLISDSGRRDEASIDETIDIVLAESPFYPEGGGQVGDVGELRSMTARILIEDTRHEADKVIVHRGRVVEGRIAVNDAVTASVDVAKRRASQRNHTATHLLHAALRQVLGDHVRQAGSLVAPDRLRFDFTHIEATKPEEIAAAQRLVNEKIREDIEVHWEHMPYDEAVASGAMALFGEKYMANVRVVGICSPADSGTIYEEHEDHEEVERGRDDGRGLKARATDTQHDSDGHEMHCFSKELCGGTHCGRTGEIGAFVIASESSVGSGLRRIEALTGPLADAYVLEQQATLARLGRKLNATAGEIEARVDALQAELETERRRLQQLERQAGRGEAAALLADAEKIGDASLLVARVTAANVEALREMGDLLREKLGSAVIVLGAEIGDRPNFLVISTKDLNARVHAGNLVKQIAAVAGGGGGGRPDMAQAGGKDASKLDEALDLARRTAREALA